MFHNLIKKILHGWVMFLMVLGMIVSGAGNLHAQMVGKVPLSAFDTDVLALTASSTVVTKTFQVDNATSVTFDLVSPANNLAIEIRTPQGLVINPANIGTIGGTFKQSTVSHVQGGGIFSPFTLIGTHYIFTLPSPPPGEYLLTIDGTALGGANTLVFTNMFSDSPIAVALTTALPDYQIKDHIALTAFVFTRGVPVSEAAVNVLVFKENLTSEVPVLLELKDDGQQFDSIAEDGIYTGVISAADLGLGKFLASATIASNPPGLFRRTAGTSFSITDNLATFTGSFSDQGIDEDGDTLLDRVNLSAGVSVLKPGRYDFTAKLTASNNVSITSH